MAEFKMDKKSKDGMFFGGIFALLSLSVAFVTWLITCWMLLGIAPEMALLNVCTLMGLAYAGAIGFIMYHFVVRGEAIEQRNREIEEQVAQFIKVARTIYDGELPKSAFVARDRALTLAIRIVASYPEAVSVETFASLLKDCGAMIDSGLEHDQADLLRRVISELPPEYQAVLMRIKIGATA